MIDDIIEKVLDTRSDTISIDLSSREMNSDRSSAIHYLNNLFSNEVSL